MNPRVEVEPRITGAALRSMQMKVEVLNLLNRPQVCALPGKSGSRVFIPP